MSVKKTFPKGKDTCTVTFTLEKDVVGDGQKVVVAGDFNQWSTTATVMKKNKDGNFTVKVTDLEIGKSYQFRYKIDDSRWENDRDVKDFAPAPFSNTMNSVVKCEKPSKK